MQGIQGTSKQHELDQVLYLYEVNGRHPFTNLHNFKVLVSVFSEQEAALSLWTASYGRTFIRVNSLSRAGKLNFWLRHCINLIGKLEKYFLLWYLDGDFLLHKVKTRGMLPIIVPLSLLHLRSNVFIILPQDSTPFGDKIVGGLLWSQSLILRVSKK